jgi:hypothetical protein
LFWFNVAIPHGGLGTRRSGVAIPHGGLGTELKAIDRKGGMKVAIPHGGLGTDEGYRIEKFHDESPSHTVGSEQ